MKNEPVRGIMELGPTELIIILVIVLLLFGPGRVGNLGGELGKAIHEFRKGVTEGADKKDEQTPLTEPSLPATTAAPTSDETPNAPVA